MSNKPLLSGEKLAFAAQRAAAWPHLLAGVIARYAELHDYSESDLLSDLSCDLDTLNRVRLCIRPGSDPVSFRSDIEMIADRVGVSAVKLAAIVRSVEVFDLFHLSSSTALPPGYRSILAAARDYEVAPQLLREDVSGYSIDEPHEERSDDDNNDTHSDSVPKP